MLERYGRFAVVIYIYNVNRRGAAFLPWLGETGLHSLPSPLCKSSSCAYRRVQQCWGYGHPCRPLLPTTGIGEGDNLADTVQYALLVCNRQLVLELLSPSWAMELNVPQSLGATSKHHPTTPARAGRTSPSKEIRQTV